MNFRLAFVTAGIFLAGGATCLAQSTDTMAQAQLTIANQMLDQQKAQILQIGGQLILSQQENTKLKNEIAELKKAAKPSDQKP